MKSELYGYSETYRRPIETLRSAEPEVLLAFQELAFSACISCDKVGHKLRGAIQGIIAEKRSAA